MLGIDNGFKTIFYKEVIDNLRDRRSVFTMLASVFLGPIFIFALLWFTEKKVNEEMDLVNSEPIPLATTGSDYAPNLMSWLESNNIEIVETEGDLRQLIRNGDFKVGLQIDAEYAVLFQSGEPAPLSLFHDSSLGGLKNIGSSVVKNALQQYSSNVASLRMQSRGINPSLLNPIHINSIDAARAEARNVQILAMIPYMAVLFIMMGGLYLAIDTTAGERENGSLESLLVQPVKRSSIVMAKLSATALFSAATFLLVLIGFALGFAYAPVSSLTLEITISEIAIIFFTCLPLVFAGSALMVLIASYTRSYKEAQSSVGFIILVPSLPLILLGILSPQPGFSNMWVPSLSQGLIMIETLKGEAISASLLSLSVFTTLLLAMVLSYIAIKLYKKERLLG